MNTPRRILIGVFALYWVALFTATHLPGKTAAQLISWCSVDAPLHIGPFAGLGFLLAWAINAGRPTRKGLFAVLLIVAIYGTLDELTQLLVPGRSAELLDWVADCAGGGVGLVCYVVSLAGSLCLGAWRRVAEASDPVV